MASGRIFCRFYSRLASSKPTHYTTLGISPSATQKEIKSKYYSLSLQCHPDTAQAFSTAHKAQFAQLNEAYSVLGNPKKRLEYDMEMGISSRAGVSPRSYSPSADDGPRASRFDHNAHYQAHYSKSFKQSKNQGVEAESHQSSLIYSLCGTICCVIYLIYGHFPNISKRELAHDH